MEIAEQNYSSAPDWPNQSEEILCPLCNYNLRGLIEPRCPECGYQFHWADLTDPTRMIHPYLFEHHPEKNVRSFIRTMLGQWMPRRFWRSLRPDMPANRRRVMIYWWVLATMMVAGSISPTIIFTTERVVLWQYRVNRERQYFLAPGHAKLLAEIIHDEGSLDYYIFKYYPAPNQLEFWKNIGGQIAYEMKSLVPVAVIFGIWPWLTLLVTNIFRVSMRQARLKPEHFMRVLIYSSDVLLVPIAAFAALDINSSSVAHGYHIGLPWLSSRFAWRMVVSTVMGISVMILVLRLIVAYRFYLRFKHATATIFATQIIVLLIFAMWIIYIPGTLEYMVNQMLVWF